MKIQYNEHDRSSNDWAAYEAPKLTVLHVEETKTGPNPDPNEFVPILQES